MVKEPSFRTVCVGVGAQPPPPPQTTSPPSQPISCLDGPVPSGGRPNAGNSDVVGSSAPGGAEGTNVVVGARPAIRALPRVSPESFSPGGGGGAKATAGPTMLETGNKAAPSGGAIKGGSTVVEGGGAAATSPALPCGHGDVGDPTASSASSSAVATPGGSPATAMMVAGAGAVPPTISYPGIQADPAEVLLNGDTMRASFAPPTVRLATFDK